MDLAWIIRSTWWANLPRVGFKRGEGARGGTTLRGRDKFLAPVLSVVAVGVVVVGVVSPDSTNPTLSRSSVWAL